MRDTPPPLSNPPTPPNLGLLVVFSPSFSRWLVDNQQWQNQALASLRESLLETQQLVVTAADGFTQILSGLTTTLESVLTMLDDVRAAQTRSEDTTRQLISAVNVELQQLRDAIAQIGNAPSAADLSALATAMNANTDRIGAALVALIQDDPAGTAPAPATLAPSPSIAAESESEKAASKSKDKD